MLARFPQAGAFVGDTVVRYPGRPFDDDDVADFLRVVQSGGAPAGLGACQLADNGLATILGSAVVSQRS